MNEKKYILFDFDGVIVDSLDLAFSINRQDKAADYTVNDYIQLFRGNIYSHFKKDNDEQPKKSKPDFFSQYEPGMMKLNCIAGMPEVIKNLASGYTLIIISSTLRTIIEKFLEKHNLLEYFTAVLGPEVEKDKTKKIQMVFDDYKTNANNCLFITDTLGDVKEAGKVDVRCIGVTWGYHPKDIIAEGNPYAFAHSPKELSDLISNWKSLDTSRI